jgi:SAM-dependent methyltransferase
MDSRKTFHEDAEQHEDDPETFNPLSDPEERQVVHNAVNSFHRYRDQAHYHITHKRRQAFYAMPQKHWSMLSKPPFNILSTFDRIDDAIEKNAEIADAFVASGCAMYDLNTVTSGEARNGSQSAAWEGPVNPVDQEKSHSTIKQLYRDWSAEGQAEREACYGPVLKALDDEFQHIPRSERGTIKVLIPGAGLGRSVFEINRAGYAVEGNEISYHQIIASNYMLNFTTGVGQFGLYPWIHGFSNHLSREDQLRLVRVPDVHPATELQGAAATSDIHPFERMSFSSGDFCVAYKEEDAKETFDAVTTIFFIDTAPNVIKYVEAVHHCLKKGGIWINLGPLKWHFENNSPGADKKNDTRNPSHKESADDGIGDPGSVELTEDEVMALLEAIGFLVERHETMQISTGYIGNPRAMWESVYHPSFWIARKV